MHALHVTVALTMGLSALTFDGHDSFRLLRLWRRDDDIVETKEMGCAGVIDKLPVLSGDGETGLVNGWNGCLFHHVEVGSKAWASL